MNQSEPTQDLKSAWEALVGRRSQLGSDATLAELALGLVRELGNGIAHREVLRELAGAWTNDWRLTLGTASLLLEQAGRRGMDEPPLSEDGPAAWAAEALQRSLDALDEADRNNPEAAGNLNAMLGNALRFCGPGKDAEAQEAFTRAIELDPERGEWWYDAGLLDKWRGRFDEGYAANEQARMRLGDQRPVLWNLAICATALGKAEEAVAIWEQLGVPARIDRSRGMPFVADLPPMLLRVLSRTPGTDATSQLPDKTVGFELVWIAPLSPCHGVVQSPTFRDAPIDYGDLVLWDGAPVAAHQASAGEAVPVFPLLEILRPGDERRLRFVGLEREPGAVRSLREALPDGVHLFTQEERVEHHCAACEAGEPHDHEPGSVSAAAPATEAASAQGSLIRGKLIVPAALQLDELLAAWESAVKDRQVSIALPELYEAIGDAKRAGQEHQAWRGIERKALRKKARP
ncbi:MAG: tetratricopeptide repeat protein [Deltaproteobacteria bacterium]|nr:tetratricopeptide repeat protein [Deltaproteobacteria bacterium]NND27156.1 tetratricopeptide repeat protein [Myxococcales bacterium]MBT8463783.1 tetratricopeptide repeat protein [Deltaproteobacteria bacterium]MBT8481448.1 tetratricopeptide repeat protein [Deltaproteobacteria bacterium]NNK09520.1 tetratricopeptide repeat protein [Myxococcales bacterium]